MNALNLKDITAKSKGNLRQTPLEKAITVCLRVVSHPKESQII